MGRRLPPIVQAELDTAPGRWSVEEGKRHYQIRIDGKLVSVWPKGTNPGDRHCIMNTRAQIRRAIRGEQSR